MKALRWQQVKDPLRDAPPVPDSGSAGCRQPSGCGRNESARVPVVNIGEEGTGKSPSRSRNQARKGTPKGGAKLVFVLDKHKKPLMPCSEKRARLLLKKGRAIVHRVQPFTIRLKDRILEQSQIQPLRLKIDPGSKTTGLAVINEADSECGKVVFLAEIQHKQGIKSSMDKRRALRRSRRNRKTRYRKPRFLNRKPEKCASCGRNARHGSRYCRECHVRRNFVDNGYRKGRLAVSLEAQVNQTMNTVRKLLKLLPIGAISTEHVKFDTQLLQNPEIKGIEYQQGELFGYEVREYLLEKWGRKCAYCGKENLPLEIEHIVPKSRGGTDRVSNLTLACHDCNQRKGSLTAEEFGYPEVQKRAKQPLKDAAMLNATRWALYNRLKETGLPVENGTGARTKKQRIEYGLPKTHYYDACCVGMSSSARLVFQTGYVQILKAVGRGTRQMCNPDGNGFPRGYRSSRKTYFGFCTGDIVKAVVPKGKYKGAWIGSLAVRASGYFDLKSFARERICQGISYKYCRLVQRADGWSYGKSRRKEGVAHSSSH